MIAALLVAAGRGHRLGGPLPKQYRLLAGEPVLRHALRPFLHHPAIGLVRVVIHPDDAELYASATQGLALPSPIFGGPTRQDSVRLGLEALAESFPRAVLIHDAARPLVAGATIDSVIAALKDAPGVIAALPVADTLKRCVGDRVTDTLDRSNVWRAQTPQGFRFPEILAAHRAAIGLALTDDAQVAERAGLEVRVVPGDEEAFKITTEPDLLRAEQILQIRNRLKDIT